MSNEKMKYLIEQIRETRGNIKYTNPEYKSAMYRYIEKCEENLAQEINRELKKTRKKENKG